MAPDSSVTLEARDGGSGRRVFTTNGRYQGNFGGLGGADTKCGDEAAGAGLPRSFKAWLSTAASPAITRLSAASGPFVSTDYKRIASSLTNSTLAVPLNVDANGKLITDTINVWTGTTPSGAAAPANCNGWTSSDAEGAAGQMNATSDKWTFNSNAVRCSTDFRLYCVEDP